jgi:hypothetical protein
MYLLKMFMKNMEVTSFIKAHDIYFKGFLARETFNK